MLQMFNTIIILLIIGIITSNVLLFLQISLENLTNK